MTSGRMEYTVALLVAFCVVGLFFFPAMQGPYPAVHGPVSALLSIRAAAGLRQGIARAASNPVGGFLSCVRLASILGSFSALSVFLSLGWIPISAATFRANRLV